MRLKNGEGGKFYGMCIGYSSTIRKKKENREIKTHIHTHTWHSPKMALSCYWRQRMDAGQCRSSHFIIQIGRRAFMGSDNPGGAQWAPNDNTHCSMGAQPEPGHMPTFSPFTGQEEWVLPAWVRPAQQV